MGMSDRVRGECPVCEEVIHFQSKAGVCEGKNYHVYNLPVVIAEDLNKLSTTCPSCNTLLLLTLTQPIPRVRMTLKDNSSGTNNDEYD